ncbi:GNAT family N-acetyltransferase [Lentibacillus sediminis]|uniref:GNAT family N-acetyltransferase n=1 Tax=Lentibacillus sediminis TaxID=1940529 RepID=UPI000C1BBD2D|nr:GNAT family protein [Lentibacillus sediminis]
MKALHTATLEFYHPEHKPNLNYRLSEEQMAYTSLPLDAIKKCEEEAGRIPVVILSDDEPAGFFVLHGWEGVKVYSENKRAILVRGYSINPIFQGKGIAKSSLSALDSFVQTHFPDKNEIILAVNHGNKAAQYVYKKGGFVDKGKRVMGRKGEQFILHKELGRGSNMVNSKSVN